MTCDTPSFEGVFLYTIAVDRLQQNCVRKCEINLFEKYVRFMYENA